MQYLFTYLKVICGYICAIIFLVPYSIEAQSHDKVNFKESISIRSNASILSAGTQEYDFETINKKSKELPFVPLLEIKENLGFTDGNYWIKFNLENSAPQAKNYYLETGRPITDIANLYLVRANGQVSNQYSGDKIPFGEKTVLHRKSIFNINLGANEKVEAFIHLKSDGEVLMLPLRLYEKDTFLYLTYKEQVFYGFFYGILILAFIIYLFFYFALNDRAFIYYGLYAFFIATLQFTLDGFFHQYITPQGGWLSDRSVLIAALLSLTFFNKYGKQFLAIASHGKFLLITNNLFNILLLASLALLVCLPNALKVLYPIANVLGMLVIAQMIASIGFLKVKRVPVDGWFMIGISFLVLGFIVFILNNFNLVENSFLTDNGAKFGIGLEIIFLSISMSNRIRNLRMENEKNQLLALQRSEDMNQIKSSLLSNISHELRTPLNLIMGMTSSLQNDNGDGNLNEKYRHIMNSSENLLGYIDDILDFTVIEKGEQELKENNFNLEDLVSRVAKINAKKAAAKNLEFNYKIAENLPKEIVGDKSKIAQIMNNLLDNAIKFTTSGQVDFKVRYNQKKDAGFVLEFLIADTGIGISEEKMSTMYESFTKKSFVDNRKFSGLGLGLFVAKKYVELHNGTISIKNNTTLNGVTCKVSLNLKENKKHIEMETSKELNSASFDLNNASILLVEDNKMNQEVIKLLVKKWKNVSLTIANHGEEAIRILGKNTFDLILMDLQMPIMDGFEATEMIRSGNAPCQSNIPIVVITADCTSESKERILGLDVNDFMTKPIKSALLFQKIQGNLFKNVGTLTKQGISMSA
ncbi:hybrid sensor histidine kinase/response regulator [Croceitalea sp. MTPC9]|uniref:hybrid sensor histidine kinase/response regulator n=1 Tax=unclassified Croceitalea TaxID=2632280 RepID=UPI002B39880C|nr:hybrid sensor histidine kinase/response regulator [Croceitalea sp. MTPC6]GMN17712.1 hybrid sensor histidine kinase/response regulator [Croceitalea sp. MTPC9]